MLGQIVGSDFSGVVQSVGKNVTRVALKPRNLSSAEAAAIPLTYSTSLQGLCNCGDLKQGGRGLVIGSSGGCGIAALRLTKSMGLESIVAVCSSEIKSW